MNDLGLKVGDRVTYEYYDKSLRERVKHTILINEDFYNFSDDVKILKVERPTLVYKTVCYKKEILDKTEKEYLSNAIRPFKNRIDFIAKHVISSKGDFLEYIYINMQGLDSFSLPYFKKGTMYKGMKHNKIYTLKELGLE